ncbi:polysaccharide biosynthesis acyltransferase UppZ [Alloalcanivorax gelatiniphagus]
MRGQISSVHVLRGVAALLVVWAHLSAYWLFTIGGTSWIQDAWRSVVAEPLHVYQDGGFLGVVLFFLISGYIVTHASLSEDRVGYLTKRLLRIFPPLAFALAVLWTLMHLMPAVGVPLTVFPGAPADRWLQSLLLLDFFTTGPRVLSVTWTLASELIFYGMVLAVIGLQRTRPLASTVAMVAAWAVACWALTSAALAGRVTPEAEGVVVLVGVLLVGRCIHLVHSRLAGARPAAALGVVTALLVGVFEERYSPGFLLERAGTSGEPVVSFVLALALFVGMLWWAPSRAVQPFSWLGDISYSLYLLHMPVGFAALGVLHRLEVPHSLATLLAIGASLLAATVAFRLVERPSQRAARRLLAPADKVTA